jgi:citrate synthase
MNILLSSAEAARYLGVSRQTLYAYVSRGWVRSEAGDSSRSRRYNRLDLNGFANGKKSGVSRQESSPPLCLGVCRCWKQN